MGWCSSRAGAAPAQVVHHLVDDPQLGRIRREHEGSEEVSGHAGHHLSHISYYVITEPIFHLRRLVHQQGWCGILIFDKYTYLASF